MKQFLIFAVLCAAVAAQALTKDEEIVHFVSMIARCNEEIPLPHKIIPKQKAKAYVFCLLRDTGFADEQGNPNVNKLRDIVKHLLPEDKFNTAIAKCKSANSSAADKALEFYDCFSEQALGDE